MGNRDQTNLPGLDCGMCGYRTCADLAEKLKQEPEKVKRCIHLASERYSQTDKEPAAPGCTARRGCDSCMSDPDSHAYPQRAYPEAAWKDSLGRDFHFYLEHFPDDPGPREIILPHNPLITRELEVKVGDILIGRPLGMSCGCPITHCGVAVEVDARTGVITWCVTGPLTTRMNGYKDLGYYIAEGYEGLVKETQCEIRIGERYFFQPRMCMLQWRHSGLCNFVNKGRDGLEIRLEGLWIG